MKHQNKREKLVKNKIKYNKNTINSESTKNTAIITSIKLNTQAKRQIQSIVQRQKAEKYLN